MLPGVEFMLLGHKQVTERDLKEMKIFTIKVVALLFLIGFGLVVYVLV